MNFDLVEAYRAGDPEALTKIYRQYVSNVSEYLARRAGRFADVADFVQEVFIRAFSDDTRAQFDGKRDYGPFLRVIARNVFIDWVRRSHREVIVESEVLEAALSESIVEPLAESSLGAKTLQLEIATEYVNALEPELKSVYEARYLHVSSQQRAAEALGISRQTLRTREQKLLAGLRRKLRRGERAANVHGQPATSNRDPDSTER